MSDEIMNAEEWVYKYHPETLISYAAPDLMRHYAEYYHKELTKIEATEFGTWLLKNTAKDANGIHRHVNGTIYSMHGLHDMFETENKTK